MRLIDAKQLEKQVKEAFEAKNPVLMGQMLRWIRKQKTIDAVEVVRCRECKHNKDTSVTEYKHCFMTGKTVWYDDFCSYGERKRGVE